MAIQKAINNILGTTAGIVTANKLLSEEKEKTISALNREKTQALSTLPTVEKELYDVSSELENETYHFEQEAEVVSPDEGDINPATGVSYEYEDLLKRQSALKELEGKRKALMTQKEYFDKRLEYINKRLGGNK